MKINKTHQVIIFNPEVVKQEEFQSLLQIVFLEHPDKTKEFLSGQPSYWMSESYPLELAQIFRHKLLRLSSELGLNLVVKMEKVK